MVFLSVDQTLTKLPAFHTHPKSIQLRWEIKFMVSAVHLVPSGGTVNVALQSTIRSWVGGTCLL